MSHAARQLEERFDALLFDRRRYRLQLTPAGLLLAQEAKRLIDDVPRLTQSVRQVASFDRSGRRLALDHAAAIGAHHLPSSHLPIESAPIGNGCIGS